MPNFVKVQCYTTRNPIFLNKQNVIGIDDAQHENKDKLYVKTSLGLYHVYNPYKTIEEFVNLFEPDQRDI